MIEFTKSRVLITVACLGILLSGCTPTPQLSTPEVSGPGVEISADSVENRIVLERELERLRVEKERIEAELLAEQQRIAEEARIAEEQYLAEQQRIAEERALNVFTREKVLGTVQALTGLGVNVLFDADWCDSENEVCGGVYTRTPYAPSTVEELTVHMSDSPAWLYALVGYRVVVHESGHVLQSYYQPQIYAAFGDPYLSTSREKIADCYLILIAGGTGTQGYTLDGSLEATIAQWMVNNL
jgi:hypothetical protein